MLAFCVALELEEVFRTDLMIKGKVTFDPTIEKHQVYMTILKEFPNANVFQINDLLRSYGYRPWTENRNDDYIAI